MILTTTLVAKITLVMGTVVNPTRLLDCLHSLITHSLSPSSRKLKYGMLFDNIIRDRMITTGPIQYIMIITIDQLLHELLTFWQGEFKVSYHDILNPAYLSW